MMPDEVLTIFRDASALLDGHFEFASGRHGTQFLQAARVVQFPEWNERLCAALAKKFSSDKVDVVIGPATGGIVLAYETARHLACRASFTEKENGGQALKRGFKLDPGDRVLVVEDIITTGGSVKKTVAHLRERGAQIVGVAVLIDRSDGNASFDCRFEALAELPLASWPPETCPMCADGGHPIDPDDLVA